MRKEYTIEVYLDRRKGNNYVKPYFFNLPPSDIVEKDSFEEYWLPNVKFLDSKCLGTMFNFFHVLSEPEEKFIKLSLIFTDKKEKHDGWIELEKKHKNYGIYEVHGLDNYKGESSCKEASTLGINLEGYYDISNPEYIYLKKI